MSGGDRRRRVGSHDEILDRCGALTGAAYVLLVMVGNNMSTSSLGPNPAHPTGEQDIASLRWLAAAPPARPG